MHLHLEAPTSRFVAFRSQWQQRPIEWGTTESRTGAYMLHLIAKALVTMGETIDILPQVGRAWFLNKSSNFLRPFSHYSSGKGDISYLTSLRGIMWRPYMLQGALGKGITAISTTTLHGTSIRGRINLSWNISLDCFSQWNRPASQAGHLEMAASCIMSLGGRVGGLETALKQTRPRPSPNLLKSTVWLLGQCTFTSFSYRASVKLSN